MYNEYFLHLLYEHITVSDTSVPSKNKQNKNKQKKTVLFRLLIYKHHYVPLFILSATKIITKVVEPKIKVIEGSLQPIIKTEGKNQCYTCFLLL